ncbi:MAG: serine hydrolase [Terracoccus sp.]
MQLSLPDAGGVTWSVAVHDLSGMPPGPSRDDATGRSPGPATVLAEVESGAVMRTASVGKILLLLETARAMTSDEAALDEPLTRSIEEWVSDSGLWHTLSVETLPLVDVAALVGAVSDNLATNVLLRRMGLDAVAVLATRLGLRATALHDRVRDERTSAHAATLSTGSAAELCTLAGRIERGEAVSPTADAFVRQWLSANVDQSMVGSAFVEHAGLDPIAHHESLGGALRLWNKTGTDAGVRADVGVVSRGTSCIAWAAVANWAPVTRTRSATPSPADVVVAPASATSGPHRGDDLVAWSVLRGMRLLGEQVLDAL